MTRLKKSLIISFFMLSLLTACSTAPLQKQRLDTAESYIQQAEMTLRESQSEKELRAAQLEIGTANAYLATLYDYRKYMTDNDMKRYQLLKKRADDLSKQIR